MTDPAAGTLAHRKEHYLDRVDPASPEALVMLLVLTLAMMGGLWLALRRRRRFRSSRTQGPATARTSRCRAGFAGRDMQRARATDATHSPPTRAVARVGV